MMKQRIETLNNTFRQEKIILNMHQKNSLKRWIKKYSKFMVRKSSKVKSNKFQMINNN